MSRLEWLQSNSSRFMDRFRLSIPGLGRLSIFSPFYLSGLLSLLNSSTSLFIVIFFFPSVGKYTVDSRFIEDT